MRRGKEIDFLVLMRAKGGSSDGALRILEADVKNGVAYLATFASGSPASFPDGDDDIPVVDLKVSIEPVQSGSGDPSPTNIRPISGRTGMTLSHSGADTSDPETLAVSWQSEAGTVYGGTLDVTTGVLTVSMVGVVVRASMIYGSYSSAEGYTVGWIANNGKPTPDNSTATDGFFSHGTVASANDQYNGPDPNSMAIETRGRVQVSFSDYNTEESLKSYLEAQYGAGTPVTAVYPLATPATYQLTPTEVKTLLGDNNIWADCGPVSVEYRADPEKYVEKRKAGGGGVGPMSLGAAPSLIRPGVGLEMQPLGLDDAGVDYINDMPDADEYLGDLEDDEDSYQDETEDEPEEVAEEEPEEGSDDDQGN